MWIPSFKLHPKKRVAQHHHHKNMLLPSEQKTWLCCALRRSTNLEEKRGTQRGRIERSVDVREHRVCQETSRNVFYVHAYLGRWSNLTKIFEMGWNHQLVYQDINCWWILATGIPEGCAKTSQNHNFVCFCCWIWSFDVLSNLETLLVQ